MDKINAISICQCKAIFLIIGVVSSGKVINHIHTIEINFGFLVDLFRKSIDLINETGKSNKIKNRFLTSN